MKNKLLFLLMFLLVGVTICTAQTPKNTELATEINRLYEIDQSVQNDVVSAYQNSASEEKIKELYKIKDETFKKHIPILKEIIQKYDFPTYDLVGKEAAGHFFTMIQHSDSDLEFQKSCLKQIEKLVKKKQFNGGNFAFLTDRVNLNSGKPQIYGTQVEYDKDDKAIPKTLKDAKNVNKRRASVGLGTIEEYLKIVNDLHKEQNKKN
jgi:hypothetical protein